MKPSSEVLKIVTPEDVEATKKPPVRTMEQNTGNDARNLMDLLGDIDGLKHEIHERMRRIEAVKQARSVLQEDAERTEALNRKLAGLGKAMSAAQAGVLGTENEPGSVNSSRVQTGETVTEMEPRPMPVKVVSETVAFPWPKVDEPTDPKSHVSEKPASRLTESSKGNSEEARVIAEASVAFGSAFQRLEEAEQSRMEAWRQADSATVEAKRLLEEATIRLNFAVSREERASAAFQAAQEALASNYQSAQERLNESERRWQQAEQATAATRSMLEQSAAELTLARSQGTVDEEGIESLRQEFIAAYRAAQSRLEEAERSRMDAWRQADEANAQAKELLEEATLRLERAVSREEQASAAFLTAHEALTTNYQSAQKRLEEAEQRWRQMEDATAETRLLLEQSTAEFAQARSKGTTDSESLELVRQEFAAAHQESQERLNEAELRWRQLEQTTAEIRQLLEQSTTEFAQVRGKGIADLESMKLMREEFAAAYQAAQTRLDESEQRLQQMERTTAEIRQLLEQSTTEFAQVRGKDVADSESLELVRQEFAAAYQSSQARLEEAELRWRQLEQTTGEIRRSLEQSTAEFAQVRGKDVADSESLELVRQEFAAAYQSSQARLEESEQRLRQMEQATAETRRLLEQSTAEFAQARSKGVADSESLELVWQEFATAYQSALERLDESEQRWRQTEQVTAETRRLLEQSKTELMQARRKGTEDSQSLELVRQEFAAAYQASQARLEESEHRWRQMEQATEEMKRALEQSRAELAQTRSTEEPGSEDLELVRQEFAAAYQSSQARLEESEQRWRQMEQATEEMRRALEQSRAELAQIRSKEGSEVVSLELVRQEFTTTYQSLSKRLEEAERTWKKGDLQPLAEGAQRVIDQTAAELQEARSIQETAAADLLSARQELTTAYQFAAVAAQRRLDAEAFFQKLGRWAVFATVLSWIAMAWMAWFTFREQVPIWGAGAATVVLLASAFLIAKRGTREA